MRVCVRACVCVRARARVQAARQVCSEKSAFNDRRERALMLAAASCNISPLLPLSSCCLCPVTASVQLQLLPLSSYCLSPAAASVQLCYRQLDLLALFEACKEYCINVSPSSVNNFLVILFYLILFHFI